MVEETSLEVGSQAHTISESRGKSNFVQQRIMMFLEKGITLTCSVASARGKEVAENGITGRRIVERVHRNVENRNATFFWQRTFEYISSPALLWGTIGTKWSLRLYPRGSSSEYYVGFYLYRHEDDVEDFEIDFELSFPGGDGSVLMTSEAKKKKCKVLKGKSSAFFSFETRTIVFAENSKFLLGDTLTARCRMEGDMAAWQNM
ncbi:hypothetical protein CEXT_506591 [Caerostris extrusa]|uniref:MATH domain-containing protein n=1 Tax=Caerostris extrusa TaxID=172846 RepID=A0AAV4N4K9_CAEEX|nr:hypothetical protein CEXT_506591 [Caerostris extrusa]